MAQIKEFKGLRPGKDMAEVVAELPYDVVDSAEARKKALGNKYNFYHITLPEVDLPEDVDPYDDIVYVKGRENLRQFIDEGILRQDEQENFYLYSLIMNGRTQTGLIACVHIDDYINDVIKKHEKVLDSKAEDRKRHIDRLSANTGLIFLLYKEDDINKQLFQRAMKNEPEYDFTSPDDIRHIFRVISDRSLISAIKESFIDLPLYIADGHHRAASAVKVGIERRAANPDHNGNENYNWFLCAIFPDNQLKIMPYNRVIKDLNGYQSDEFMKKLNEKFNIAKAHDLQIQRHKFRMYLEGEWHILSPKFSISADAVFSLDAQILQDTILDPVLGIKEPTKDKRIGFVGGIKGDKELKRLVDSGGFKVAFSLHPVLIDELIRVSDEGKLMPPKSTWFEPKLRSGLILHLL